jgi:cobalt/nickel transport system permease protein
MDVSSARLARAMTPAAWRPDCRVVLLSALAVTLIAVLTPPGHGLRLAALAAVVAGLLALSRAPLRWLLSRLTLLLPFAFLILISVPFMVADRAPSALLRVETAAGRTLIAFGALAWVSAMASPVEIVAALGQLRAPRLLVALLAFLIRYLGVLEEEARRMLRARDLRGTPPRIATRAAVAGCMVGSLFIRSFERAERVGAAMEARGFTGHFPTPVPRPLSSADRLLLGGAFLLLAGLVAMT